MADRMDWYSRKVHDIDITLTESKVVWWSEACGDRYKEDESTREERKYEGD